MSIKGNIPVHRNPLMTLPAVIPLYQAWANTVLNSYSVTTRPLLAEINCCTALRHATFNGANGPLSRGWHRWVVLGGNANIITPSFAANLIMSGQKWDLCPSISRSRGRADGA